MHKARDLKHLVLDATLAATGLSALAAVNLTTFAPGTPIKSSEVNANFSSLKANIEALQAPGGIAGAQVAEKSVEVTKLAATGSAADGVSLQLSDNTFSIRDGGVNTGELANGAVGSAKLADGAVTGAKLTNGAVTSPKLELPLQLSSSGASSSSPVLAVTNSAGSRSSNPVGVLGRLGAWNNRRPSAGVGVWGDSADGIGVAGYSNRNIGVAAFSMSERGMSGGSASGIGVQGRSGVGPALSGENGGALETLRLVQIGTGALIDTRGAGGVTVFSVDRFGNVYSAANSYSSDRRLKTNLRDFNAQEVLEKLTAMPVTRWNYARDAVSVQHIGPMAQDFHRAFGLNGAEDTRINAVALAEIQGLNQKLEAENTPLKRVLVALEARLSALEKASRSR